MKIKKVPIKDLKPGLVKKVEVLLSNSNAYREDYFEWKETALTAAFSSNQISGGILRSWKHEPIFKQAESHVDAELFHFMTGIALMMFIDYKDGRPDLKTAQVVRIQPGTTIIIAKGKGHFVPVAEGDIPVSLVVVAPKMEAPRVRLDQPILGVE
jgi:hypothetical protein